MYYQNIDALESAYQFYMVLELYSETKYNVLHTLIYKGNVMVASNIMLQLKCLTPSGIICKNIEWVPVEVISHLVYQL